METNEESPQCPKCRSTSVVEIVYGIPGQELMEKEQAGEIELGGCIMYSYNPKWACKDCRTQFGGGEI